VSRAKNLLGAAKAGHTGTLDPMATGLLPLAFGEATKFSHALLDADKTYLATVRLGVTTTTGDLEGDVLERAPVEVDRERLEAALQRFRGDIEQVPPMYSALKHQGKPLYVYARAGRDVARTPRPVTISALEVQSRLGCDVEISVRCSKGTYIRVLAEDIGRSLGCGGTLASLRRTAVGRYTVEDALTLAELNELDERERMACLRPIDALVAELRSCALDADRTRQIVRGQTVAAPEPLQPGPIRLYGPDAAFLGLADMREDGLLQARRLVSTNAAKT
jgi:tRNA pseudouridine55 synthase